MSAKVSIQELGKSRNFSGVGAIETETPEGDSCFWVPESERELETEYVIKNGTYRPKKYGFSDIDVNVFDLTTDLDGNDWKIDIDDIDMPDISLPDFDIDLSLDTDGMPNIDFDIHIITVDDDEIEVVLPGGEKIIINGPSIPDKDSDDWPGWEDLDPDIQGDFDDWWEDGKDPVVILNAIEISYDPSTGEWTVTALVECTVGDTTYNPGDVIKTWPGTEKVDFYIQVGIALPDLSETIDLDAGFDVSLDVDDMSMGIDDMSLDLIGVDLNGDDIKVDIDLGDMSIDVESCPESIYILSQPASLVYTEGDTIDFSGLAVAALDKDGMDWPDPSTFTPIPLSELSLPSGIKAVYDDQHSGAIVNTSSGAVTVSAAGPEDMVNAWTVPPRRIKEGSAQLYMWIPPESPDHYQFIIIGKNTVVTGNKHEDGTWTGLGGFENSRANQRVGWPWAANTISPPPEITNGTWRNNIKECIQTITVGWTGPCMQYMETSFDIYVRKNDTDASGGGTTISGNYGGSHHSGKF